MGIRLPAMQALRAFEATARLGSLSRAAEAMHLTHGAISHQIKSLEAELGVALIEREGRGIRITETGQRFAARVRTAFDELGVAVREATQRANPRLLRVSVVPSFAARWLLPRIGRFMAAHPEIDLDVGASNLNADFRSDPVDVAIRYGFGSWEGLRAEFLLDEKLFAVCSPQIAGGVPSTPQDLSRHILLRSSGDPWKPWFDAAGLDWPEPQRGPIFHDSSHMMQAVAEGQGIALARSSLLGNDERNGLLRRLFGIEIPAPKCFYLVYPPGFAQDPKLLALRTWLHEEVARDRDPRA